MKKTKKIILILVCFLIVLSGIGIVTAETLTGTLADSNYTQSIYSITGGSGTNTALNSLTVNNIEYSTGLFSLVLWPATKGSFDGDAPPGSTIQFTAHLENGTQIGAGTLGYQRLWSGTTEQPGYVWAQFTSWNNEGLTGDKRVNFNFTPGSGSIYNASFYGENGFLPTTGQIGFGLGGGVVNKKFGQYYMTRTSDFSNSYSVTKSSSTTALITGTITKGEGSGSRVYVINAENNQTITNEYTVNTNTFNFTAPVHSIRISLYDSFMAWHNSSALFSNGTIPAPTVTPTVTPTGVPTIAPGYVRTTVKTIDGTSGNEIHGSNIFLKDVEGDIWSNSTSDGDGSHYIDTLPYHTINAYGTFTVFADHYSDASALGLPTGYYGGFTYYLSMFPPAMDPGDGNVNLYVSTREADTYNIIRDASVTVSIAGSSTQGGNTGSTGTETFVVPNQTVINIAASKPGYIGSNTVINSGTGTSASATVYLTAQTVTPTVTRTVAPGEITVRPTVDPHDPSITGSTNAKGQEIMNWLAMNGMDLVQLCFMVTVLALLGVKLGK